MSSKLDSSPAQTPAGSFLELELAQSILADISAAGWQTPTPVQANCVPPALQGKDVIGLAQTGTGKTGAFALPIIHRLAGSMHLGALVLAPTRELAQQITGMFELLGKSSGVRVACVVGGLPMDDDIKALRSWPNVLVATPGRLIDHIQYKSVSLHEIEILAVDEADRMHDMGFMPQITRILESLPSKRQTLMFTATLPSEVEKIARGHMRHPVRIQVGRQSAPAQRAKQHLYKVDEQHKTQLLDKLLSESPGRVLVFVRTKRGVDRLGRAIHGQSVARIHGDREQAHRDEALSGFRTGKYRVLIATDIAARGIDVENIEHVINYDFPRVAEDYIHRIGRTARVAASGLASSFVTSMDRRALMAVERLTGEKLPLESWPAGSSEIAEEEPHDSKPRKRRRKRTSSKPRSRSARTRAETKA